MFELILIPAMQWHLLKKTPEAFLLPSEASIVKAAAGWAHCVSVTGNSFPSLFLFISSLLFASY